MIASQQTKQRCLVVAAVWIETDDPGTACDVVAARLRGLRQKDTKGAVVHIADSSAHTDDFRNTMRRLHMEEVVA
jgi:hypothetical protein